MAAPGEVDLDRARTSQRPARRGEAKFRRLYDTLTDALKMSGFQVSQGYPRLYQFRDCINYTYPVLKNCLSGNPQPVCDADREVMAGRVRGSGNGKCIRLH